MRKVLAPAGPHRVAAPDPVGDCGVEAAVVEPDAELCEAAEEEPQAASATANTEATEPKRTG